MAPLRLALPRASTSFPLHSAQLQALRLLRRHASTTPPPKPRVLAPPDKFRPPSHGSRLPSRLRTPRYTGPALTESDLARQKTKRYPHMMPPEGSFMHWFLTNRSIHVWITMGILTLLITQIWLNDFLSTTPYRALLPPNSLFLTHPLAFIRRWWEIYEMHVAHTSAITAERRKAKVEDVRKRSEYRKAHGLQGETAESGGLGGWTVREEDTAAAREGGSAVEVEALRGLAGAVEGGGAAEQDATTVGGEAYVDFEGKIHVEPRKKWFGIW